MIKFFLGVWPSANYATRGDYVLAVFLYLLIGFAAFVAFSLVFRVLRWFYILIFFKSGYSPVKLYPGTVEDMKYTAPRTEVRSIGKTTTTQYHPEKNEVTIKTELKTTTLDSDVLYQRVRVGEDVTVKTQTRYVKPKYWQGRWEYYEDILISVISCKNQEVTFNAEKKVTQGLK